MFLVSLVVLAILTGGETPPDNKELSIDEVAQANANAVAGIRSLSVHAELDYSGKKILDYKFLMDPTRRRLTSHDLRQSKGWHGESPGCRDCSNGDKEFRILDKYDPNNPAPLGEYSLATSEGSVAARQDKPKFPFDPTAQLMLNVAKSIESWPLSQLVKDAAFSKVIGRPSTTPRGVYQLEIVKSNDRYLISVDPTKNFMISKVELFENDKPVYITEVESFQDCGNDVFVPTRILNTLIGNNGANLKMTLNCEIISCNKPLPSEALEVQFPDWLRVEDQRDGKVHIWGADGKPRLTFNSRTEYQDWRNPRLAKIQMDNFRRLCWMIILVFCAFVLIGGIVHVVLRHWRVNNLPAGWSDDDAPLDEIVRANQAIGA